MTIHEYLQYLHLLIVRALDRGDDAELRRLIAARDDLLARLRLIDDETERSAA